MDELDLSIAKELELDARQSSRKLAAKLGVSGATISKRLKRLVDANILSFCCLTDPAVLGFRFRTVFCLKTTPGKEAKVVRALRQHGCVQNVDLVAGRYDVVVYTIFRDHRRQLQWMTNELGAMEDVISYEQVHQLQMVKNSWGYTDSTSVLSADTEPLDIGESDLKLIRALEANPREEINSLAKKAGLGRKTAARRLQKLLDDDIVSIVSITDPTAMGFSVHALIFLKVRLDKLPSVADILTAHEKITHVVILGGAYNMLVAAAFENLGGMSRFLLSELGEMAGVIERETMIHIGRPEWSVRLMEALDYE